MCVVASLKKQLLVCRSDVCGSQFEETTSGMKSDLNVLMCLVASLKLQLLVCSSDVCGSQFEETTSGMQF